MTLTYKPSRDQTFYGTASSGYRPGGFNASPDLAHLQERVCPQLRGGFKSAFLDGPVQINGAVFYEMTTTTSTTTSSGHGVAD